MPNIVLTEFSQEASTAFAGLLEKGGFQLVQVRQMEAHSYNEVIYASPTCQIRFKRSTGKLAEEWDMDMALQPQEGEMPSWIPVWIITGFLKKETPQEVFDRSIKREEDLKKNRKKKWGPQITMHEYANSIEPLYTQLLNFFKPRGFKKRSKDCSAYLKRHGQELARLSAAYHGYEYTSIDYRTTSLPGTTDFIELTNNGYLRRYGTITWCADTPVSKRDGYIRFTWNSKRIVAHTWNGYKVSLDPETGKILSTTRTK